MSDALRRRRSLALLILDCDGVPIDSEAAAPAGPVWRIAHPAELEPLRVRAMRRDGVRDPVVQRGAAL